MTLPLPWVLVMAANSSGNPGSGADAGKLVTTWRTVQKLDADAWRKLRDDAPLRFVRYLGALGVVVGAWALWGPLTAPLPGCRFL